MHRCRTGRTGTARGLLHARNGKRVVQSIFRSLAPYITAPHRASLTVACGSSSLLTVLVVKLLRANQQHGGCREPAKAGWAHGVRAAACRTHQVHRRKDVWIGSGVFWSSIARCTGVQASLGTRLTRVPFSNSLQLTAQPHTRHVRFLASLLVIAYKWVLWHRLAGKAMPSRLLLAPFESVTAADTAFASVFTLGSSKTHSFLTIHMNMT